MNTLQRVMYVEDDPDIQAVAKIALETVGGFSLKICSSGEEALREAEAFAPELILLDVMMPGMDGLATFKGMREKQLLTDVPIVFLSAKTQPSEVAHYKSLGVTDFIAKPFDPMTLADQVREIWQK